MSILATDRLSFAFSSATSLARGVSFTPQRIGGWCAFGVFNEYALSASAVIASFIVGPIFKDTTVLMAEENGSAHFVVIHVDVENKDSEGRMFLGGELVVNRLGKKLVYDHETITGKSVSGEQLNPLVAKSGIVVFEVPKALSGTATWNPGRGIAPISLGRLWF